MWLEIQTDVCVLAYAYLYIYITSYERSGLPVVLAELANFCLKNIQSKQNATIYY